MSMFCNAVKTISTIYDFVEIFLFIYPQCSKATTIQFLFIYFQSTLFLLYVTVIASEESNSTLTKTTNTKVAEKLSYPKKVSSIKKHPSKTSLKKVADITEKFKDLPADDLAFIKELDKQFKLHGGKVKIKVENKNVTGTKNSKRTIDGELG